MNRTINRFFARWGVTGMWLAGLCTLAALILGSFSAGAAAVFFALGAVLAGLPVLWQAVQGLRYRTVGIELLVSIAVIGAFCIGELSEAAIVTFLFRFGSWLEQKTMKKTRSAIKALTALAPSTAWKLEGETFMQIDVDEVEPGDILLVKTGGQIPVDGSVVQGEGYVNEASVTGESVPRHRQPGDPVYAGTMLDSGTIRMRASRVGEDTTFAKIIALVEEAQDAKSPAERFIDRFAKYYTPAVVVLAAAVYLLLRDVDTAITVLVLACPGALVIGAPIANVAGIGAGAREGILLKGGDSIHTFAGTDTVVFDKTGTLTMGQPEVVACHGLSADADSALALAASAELASDHPLGRAIVRCAEGRNLSVSQIESTEALKGQGIRVAVQGRQVLIGNARLMECSGIALPPEAVRALEGVREQGASEVLVAVDGVPSLVLGIADAVKPDAAECIRSLKKSGVQRFIILTGDNRATAEAVANALGIKEFHGELLPQDKLAFIRELQSRGRNVTFAGDGINDSPALTAADTGIAMGSGTDVAIDSSDVVLIKSDLTSLALALRLARRTKRVLRQNIVIAVGTVIFLLIGLFAGFIHMAVGMLVHEASILVVILNAMRLLIIGRKIK